MFMLVRIQGVIWDYRNPLELGFKLLMETKESLTPINSIAAKLKTFVLDYFHIQM